MHKIKEKLHLGSHHHDEKGQAVVHEPSHVTPDSSINGHARAHAGTHDHSVDHTHNLSHDHAHKDHSHSHDHVHKDHAHTATPAVVETTTVVAPVATTVVDKEVIVDSGLVGTTVAAEGHVRAAPVVTEVVEKPVVVHEHLHPVEKEEIQPVIYREREQLEVRQVTQQLHETEIEATRVEQRELPAQVRDVLVEKAAPIQENIHTSSVEVDATAKSTQVLAPIVNETVKRTVVEEVQPVLEKDVIVPTLVQKVQPIYEKIVEAPIVHREVLAVKEVGTVHTTATTGVAVHGDAVAHGVVPLGNGQAVTSTTVETKTHVV